ncbi:hypothetical protein ACHAW5_010975 [Stephanodiscus triporus]|uniref:Cysteine dioxygenase n=1 Tax=Stephanodiscus triporus TaxID=2934178 RepID=A0ABD3PPB9_9STRA
MHLARHGEANGKISNVPWHKDNNALEITLNDNYDGGHVLHLNETGVYKTKACAGFVTAHTNDIVHGVTYMPNGVKYMLILKQNFGRPDKVGVVRLSMQMVSSMADGA